MNQEIEQIRQFLHFNNNKTMLHKDHTNHDSYTTSDYLLTTYMLNLVVFLVVDLALNKR